MTTRWKPPADAWPRHFAVAMLLAATGEERESIVALARSEWHGCIWTHYGVISGWLQSLGPARAEETLQMLARTTMKRSDSR